MFEASAGGNAGRPSALMLAQAEELLGTLPGVVSVRIEATPAGDIVAIHVLTSVEVAPKQTVRNIESALLAHLGLRVDHRKVSVATTVDAPRLRPTAVPRPTPSASPAVETPAPRRPAPFAAPTLATAAAAAHSAPESVAPPHSAPMREPSRTPVVPLPVAPFVADAPAAMPTPSATGRGDPRSITPVGHAVVPAESPAGRRYVFDDVEVRRSRTGLHCRVTLTRGDETFEGEAEGLETEVARLELAARATVLAIAYAEGLQGGIALAGVRRLDAFDRAFAFAGVTMRRQRESMLLTGTCEIRDAVEVAGVLSVLDATNRWLAAGR
jgi:hypothetical protein